MRQGEEAGRTARVLPRAKWACGAARANQTLRSTATGRVSIFQMVYTLQIWIWISPMRQLMTPGFSCLRTLQRAERVQTARDNKLERWREQCQETTELTHANTWWISLDIWNAREGGDSANCTWSRRSDTSASDITRNVVSGKVRIWVELARLDFDGSSS